MVNYPAWAGGESLSQGSGRRWTRLGPHANPSPCNAKHHHHHTCLHPAKEKYSSNFIRSNFAADPDLQAILILIRFQSSGLHNYNYIHS